MKFKLIASLSAALISVTLLASTANACESSSDCGWSQTKKVKRIKKRVATVHHVRHQAVHKVAAKKHRRGAAIVDSGPVVAMIKAQAPAYGVPTWFALRIAKIESGYNPRVRGAAGEYGVYQLKCATARGVGFRGNCAGLLNASTNIKFGLKHLQIAVRTSRGNLKLAASKHNGGLGRKSLVPRYVAMVF
jgi:soluble lytic murein transglycosylase-like protein